MHNPLRSGLSLLVGSALLCTATLRADQTPPVFDRPLAELMDATTFQATGLSKLSEQELTALRGWLEAHASASVEKTSREVARKEAKRQAEAGGIPYFETPSEERFTTRIPGRFEGILGRGQAITLENGQVWRVMDNQTRRIILKQPEVSLRASALGNSYLMTIRGLGFDVRVERIK